MLIKRHRGKRVFKWNVSANKSKLIYAQSAFIAVLFMLVFVTAVFKVEAAEIKGLYPYITTTFPISGSVRKLIIPKKTPNFLFALVNADGMPKPSDKTGLYVFNISEARNPTQIAYLPITSPIGMELSQNGSTLFLYSAYYQGHDPKDWYGVLALDISAPHAIREVGRFNIDILQARLSVDGTLLFVTERGLINKNEQNYFFSIYRVSTANKPKLLTQVKRQRSQGYGFLQTPDGKHLLIADDNNLIAYDIANPSSPKEKLNVSHHLGFPKAIGNNGTAYLFNGGDLVLASLIPKITKIGVLHGRFPDGDIAHITEDNKAGYFLTHDKTIHVLDFTNPRSPMLSARYKTPNYVGSIIPARNSNLIYAGLLGSIIVIDPAKAVMTSELLITAHAEALRQFKRSDLKSDFIRVDNAINILEAAGIREAIEKSLQGLSNKTLAGILNDYGFFLTKSYRNEEAIEIYKKVIKLDPKRAVAYLNLGDSIRKKLPTVGSFQEKIALTKKIKTAYIRYKELLGNSTPDVDSFLSLNIADTPITDFCEYVAAYTNQGRLKELFGSGKSVARWNGQDKMTVEISYEGTGHFPYVKFIDNKTNDEIDEQIPENGKDVSWADHIDIVPFSDGHHLLYHNYDRYLVISTPIGAARETGKNCEFNVRVIESFDKKGMDTELCRLVQSSEHPPFISFEESNYLNNDMLDAAGYSQHWTNEFGSGKVDFDNDGKEDALVHLKYLSGAGPGCAYDFFDLFNTKKDGLSTSTSRSLLLKMQGIENKSNRLHPVPFCHGNTTGWFRYNGVTYFETKYPEDHTSNSAQEFHTVSYVKDGRIKKVCEAKFTVKVEVQPELGPVQKIEKVAGDKNPWEYAILRPGLETVKALIEGGRDLNEVVDKHGDRPLHLAVQHQRDDILELLLKAGTNPNVKNKIMSPLHEAVWRGTDNAVELLLKHGAEAVDKNNPNNYNALSEAMRGSVKKLELLLRYGTVITDTAAIEAVAGKNEDKHEKLKLLIKHGLDVNKEYDKDELVEGIKQKLPGVWTVGPEFKTKKTNKNLLQWAKEAGDPETVRILIDAGAKK